MKKGLLFRVLLLPAMLLAGTAGAGAYSFESGGIYYDINSGDSTLTVINGGTAYTGDIAIPGHVRHNDKTYEVTDIGRDAFNGCSLLTSVSIPNTVVRIGQEYYGSSFRGCTGLTSIVIPNSVTTETKKFIHSNLL